MESVILTAAFAMGMFAWIFVASIEESTWDRYMSTHGGMSAPPEFIQAHKLGDYVMPLLTLTPVVLGLLFLAGLLVRRRLVIR